MRWLIHLIPLSLLSWIIKHHLRLGTNDQGRETEKAPTAKCLKSKLTVDEQAFSDQCRLITEELDHTKTEYHCAEMSACNTQQMYKLVNKLTVYKPAQALPAHSSKKDMANRFSKFFDQKIKNIRNTLNDMSVECNPMTDINTDNVCQTTLDHFEPIKKSAVKSWSFDPLPACMI